MNDSQTTGTADPLKDFTVHNGCLLALQGTQLISNYAGVPTDGPTMNWNDLGRYIDSEIPEFRRIVSAVVFKLQGTEARSAP